MACLSLWSAQSQLLARFGDGCQESGERDVSCWIKRKLSEWRQRTVGDEAGEEEDGREVGGRRGVEELRWSRDGSFFAPWLESCTCGRRAPQLNGSSLGSVSQLWLVSVSSSSAHNRAQRIRAVVATKGLLFSKS